MLLLSTPFSVGTHTVPPLSCSSTLRRGDPLLHTLHITATMSALARPEIVSIPTRPIFSAEIVDLVIDFAVSEARDWSRTLLACALVCKGWVPRSRYHTFGLVTLGPRATRVASFLKLFKSSSAFNAPPTFVHAIRQLNYVYVAGDVPQRHYNSAEPPHVINLLPRLPPLPRLESLRFIAQRSANQTSTSRYPRSDAFDSLSLAAETMAMLYPNIIELDIQGARIQSSRHLFKLISSFPMIRQLRLNDVEWDAKLREQSEGDQGRSHRSSTLQWIHLDHCSNGVLQWLALHGSALQIRHFDVTVVTFVELEALRNICERSGEHIVTVDIRSPWLQGQRIPGVQGTWSETCSSDL